MNALEKLSVKDLDSGLRKLRSTENAAIADIILYLHEIDSRKAYRELGYSSLFTYCTEALNYSEGSAYRRVQAARAVKLSPSVLDSIKDGRLSLCAVAEVSKVKDDAKKLELFKSSEGKMKVEVQALTAMHLPPENIKRETIKAKVIETKPDLFSDSIEKPKENVLHYNFHVEVDEEFMRLYKEVKEITGQVPASEIFRRCMKEYLEKRRVAKRKAKSSPESKRRFIPKSVKIDVLKRDGKQCTFVTPDGKRCAEKHALQFDHVTPYAAGGSNASGNLRLLCKAHNLLMAEKYFGKDKMMNSRANSIV